jgi:hypothetical protein
MGMRQDPPKSRRTITSTNFMPAAGREPRLLVRYASVLLPPMPMRPGCTAIF